MGYSKKITDKEAQRILAQKTHKEQVKESFEVAKEIVTQPIGSQIQKDFDLIADAIQNLDKSDKLYGQKKNQLQGLVQKVASKYAISKQSVVDVQEELNKILGANTSNTI